MRWPLCWARTEPNSRCYGSCPSSLRTVVRAGRGTSGSRGHATEPQSVLRLRRPSRQRCGNPDRCRPYAGPDRWRRRVDGLAGLPQRRRDGMPCAPGPAGAQGRWRPGPRIASTARESLAVLSRDALPVTAGDIPPGSSAVLSGSLWLSSSRFTGRSGTSALLLTPGDGLGPRGRRPAAYVRKASHSDGPSRKSVRPLRSGVLPHRCGAGGGPDGTTRACGRLRTARRRRRPPSK